MNRAAKFFAAIFFIAGTVTHAGDRAFGIRTLYLTDQSQWEDLDTGGSFRSSLRPPEHNRRIFRSVAQRLFKGTLTSLGVSERGVAMTDTAIGFAAEGVRLDLNDSKTMTLGLDELISRDRTFFLKVKLKW